MTMSVWFHFSLDHDGKEKVQFGIQFNQTNTVDNWLFSIPLQNEAGGGLKFGLKNGGYVLELGADKSVRFPRKNDENLWHKVVIIKHHGKLTLKVDERVLLLDLLEDTSKWLQFAQNQPISFNGKQI